MRAFLAVIGLTSVLTMAFTECYWVSSIRDPGHERVLTTVSDTVGSAPRFLICKNSFLEIIVTAYISFVFVCLNSFYFTRTESH